VNDINKNSHLVNLIFDRLKIVHGLNSDLELANFMGLYQSTLSMQRKRGTVDLDMLLKISNGIDLNWLFRIPSQAQSEYSVAPLSTSEQAELLTMTEKQMIDEIIRLRRKISNLDNKTTSQSD
jgi:hypothetical protein